MEEQKFALSPDEWRSFPLKVRTTWSFRSPCAPAVNPWTLLNHLDHPLRRNASSPSPETLENMKQGRNHLMDSVLSMQYRMPLTHNTDLYRFATDGASGLPVASCVLIKGKVQLQDGTVETVVRPYTPISPKVSRELSPRCQYCD